MDNNSIKENIRRIRKIRGYTQHELATRCGISMTHYRSIEVGTTAIINPIVLRISEVLDIGIGYLQLGSRISPLRTRRWATASTEALWTRQTGATTTCATNTKPACRSSAKKSSPSVKSSTASAETFPTSKA